MMEPTKHVSSFLVRGQFGIGVTNHMIELLFGEAHGIASEFGAVVALQQQKIVFWVSLRQDECAVSLSLLVEVGDIGTREVAIVAARAEDNPPFSL